MNTTPETNFKELSDEEHLGKERNLISSPHYNVIINEPKYKIGDSTNASKN